MLYAISRGLDSPAYGADADHIPVKRSADGSGLEHAKRLVDCAKDYTFFTVDTSDLFRYHALSRPSAEINDELGSIASDGGFHRLCDQPFVFHNQVNGRSKTYTFTKDEAARCCLKYHDSTQAAAELYKHIVDLKKGRECFDFEFSMDEIPLDVIPHEAVTTPKELIYVLIELQRLGLKLSHVAPNFGVEKGVDYRLGDGLPGLKERVSEMAAIAEAFGAILGLPLRRRSIALDATSHCRGNGRQAAFQSLTAVADHFTRKPCTTAAMACSRNGGRGLWSTRGRRPSPATRWRPATLVKLTSAEPWRPANFRPLPSDKFFRNYAFAAVGKRDSGGSFTYRDRFYSAGSAVEASTDPGLETI